MKHLLLLSDIDSFNLPQHLSWRDYSTVLSEKFQLISALDVCDFAGVERSACKEEKHDQFINGGIERASLNLVKKFTKGVTAAVGLSIGGTILWRAAQNGLKTNSIICMSSTRLRFEKVKPPDHPVRLFFGSDDPHKPGSEWFSNMNLKEEIIPGVGHDFYKEEIVFSMLNLCLLHR